MHYLQFKRTTLLLSLCFFAFTGNIFAQEVLSPLSVNPAKVYYQKNVVNQPHGLRDSDTLELPFFDDFSGKDIYPDSTKWTDRHVFINRFYPTNPKTLGVATFDGLNEFGLPHVDSLNPGPDGPADTLTSKPLNLNPFGPEDSVYLSFLFQPQGKGDWPNIGDSLVVELLFNGVEWRKVWSVDGYTTQVSDPVFRHVMIPVTDPFYFYNGFQFRFRNYATITGNNDHWHVDYVRVGANRTVNDTIMNDVSFIGVPDNILRNYRSMPWNHFFDYQENELKEDFEIRFRNNFNAAKNTTYELEVNELFSNTNLEYQSPVAFNFQPFAEQSIFFDTEDFTPFQDFQTDSVIIEVKSYLNPAGDVNPLNDTIRSENKFFNYFAYDNGNAEKAYGVEGVGLKGFAMRFDLNEPDTVRAIKIHFAQILEDVSNMLFSIYIWKELDLSNTGEGDSVLYIGDFKRPHYIDERNGFAVYVPEEELIVDGSIYIGWQQTDERNLQVGFDISRNSSDRMYYQSNGIWYTSVVNGTPMIRLAVGPDLGYIATNVNEQALNSTNRDALFKIFPNPGNDLLNISMLNTKAEAKSELEIYDINGRLIIREEINGANYSLNTNSLRPGMYVVRITNGQSTETYRWIKQ
ncbi:MAG: T9SS C-terminal target domain-containing protein [Chitinophagaceae bacterium]|nr:MAG: T9SS C-terminal target domain-containing protein [Chitinophagaceae bacterium]